MTCRNCGKFELAWYLQHGKFCKLCYDTNKTLPPFDIDKVSTKYKIAECGEDADGWYVTLNNEQILFGLKENQAEIITKTINETIDLRKI